MSASVIQKWVPEETPLLILSEGCFGAHQSKTAIGVIRYGQWPISGVIDSHHKGKTVSEVMSNLPCHAPIVTSVQEGLALQPRPKALLVGTAPIGGGLPDIFKSMIIEAIHQGLDIINGLHIFLNQIPEIKALAEEKGVRLWDVRSAPEDNIVAQQLPRPPQTHVITMVGSDCSVGKMSVALEMHHVLQGQQENSAFVATGQTGIMISGAGVPLDRVIGDFMAGYIEREIDRVIQDKTPRWVLVEGQGSLLHPAYSGVTMSLLHGSAPDAMILCHNPHLKTINQYDKVPLPPLSELVNIYQTTAGWIKPAQILGVALNTSGYSESEARQIIEDVEQETQLPATDAVRFGADKLVNALMAAF